MNVHEAMARWRPGSHDWSWRDEAEDLWHRDRLEMYILLMSMMQEGLRAARKGEEPICLGDDGRVWAGHHRLITAWQADKNMPLPKGVVFGTGGTRSDG